MKQLGLTIMPPTRVALVGDFNPAVIAHQAIERSFELAKQSALAPVEPAWVGTEKLIPGESQLLGNFDGIWCVPASPYRNEEGALWAIRFAREHFVPFLGTCGGFQHALIEYARNVLGLANAEHAELNGAATLAFVSRLGCPLVETSQAVKVVGDTLFGEVYGSNSGLEGYCCSYGLNPEFEHLLGRGPLEIVARAADGEARAFALRGHPFFIGTLFQPERRALTGWLHPLVSAFFAACGAAERREHPNSTTDKHR